MGAFTQAFFNRMSGDSTLTALLGTYGGVPSIFTKTPIPADYDLATDGAYILTSGQAIDLPGEADAKNSAGREISRDIKCYTDIKESPTKVEAIAERVLVLFQRHKLTVTGFTVDIAEATGPLELDEDDALGRVVTVRLVMRAT